MEAAIGRIVTPVLDRLAAELGTGSSAVLYGSAARGEYRAGVSDVNLLVLADSLEPTALRRLSGALEEIRRERQSPPLLMQRDEWLRATDAFPICRSNGRSSLMISASSTRTRGSPMRK